MKDLINYLRNKNLVLNGMNFRHLELDDYHKNYLDLFKAFTDDINYNESLFFEYYSNYLLSDKIIYIIELNNIILGSITILLDQKPFHNFQYIVHIEDLVVNEKIRNNGLGSILLNKIKHIIEDVNSIDILIYKIILNCDIKLENFYTKNGFIKKGNYMAYYI